jgi:WD40 repeat protein
LLTERRDVLVCLQDFVSAVMDVDYSPTGREFVAGGYDRSVRIFNFNAGHSREVGLPSVPHHLIHPSLPNGCF